MKISDMYQLGKTQYELDFVDVDVDIDTPLFLDPYFISKCEFPFAIDAHRTLKSYFENLLTALRHGDMNLARELFEYLGETNEVCLGFSRNHPKGKGMGPTDAQRILDSLLESKAFETGVMEDIEDFRIFVKNVDKDKMSDMTTNIIKLHLVQYTQAQCRLWGIPLTHDVPSGYFWNRKNNEWVSEYSDMLVANSKKILLVPKRVVSFSKEYTPQKYVQHFVLNFLQNEHLRLNSNLVQKRNNKDQTRYVTKKSIREDIQKAVRLDKDWLAKFTKLHPDIFNNFKKQTKRQLNIIRNSDIIFTDVKQLCRYLSNKLTSIPVGPEHASIYHRTVVGILELLFYPFLCSPIVETEIHDGRKRIDITFDNCAEEGFFFRLCNTHAIPSSLIMVECKNYSRDIANPELDQISGRFSPNRGKMGFVVCRSFDDMQLFLRRCSDTYKDQRGLVLPLQDIDLVFLLEKFNENDYSIMDEYLQRRFHDIALI